MGKKNKLLRLGYTAADAARTEKMIKKAMAAQRARPVNRQNFSGRKG